MSKKKRYFVHIWFLDDDLASSAKMLADKDLSKTIDGCIGAIVSTHMYLVGIRSMKFYSYFFSKENIANTLYEKFSNWPLKKKPKFNAYSWKESKWCRMCHENYDYVTAYLSILFDEYAYRYSHEHEAKDVLSWSMASDIIQDFAYAHVNDVVLPWKTIDPQFRTNDIIEGYRKQYCSQIDDGDAFKAYAKCKRDIPDFIVEAFDLKNAFER